jgi:anti-sigma factor RsiW
MADCRDVESLLTPYVDGEASPADRAVVDAHVLACPPCAERLTCETEVRDAFAARRSALRPAASADLRRRCEAACRPPGPFRAGAGAAAPTAVLRRVMSRQVWVPLSMAATILLAVAGVFFYGLRGGGEALAAQLVSDHVKCFEFAPEPTLLPDAQALAREWLTTRGWNLKVPAGQASEQLELLGVRRCISTDGMTAHVMYKWRGEPLSVYVVNHEDKHFTSSPRLVERFGQEAVVWCARGRTYAVVARGRPTDVEHVAQYVRLSAE